MTAVNASKNQNNSKVDIVRNVLSGFLVLTLAFVLWELLVLEGLVVTSPVSILDSSASTKLEEARLRSERVNKEDRPLMTAAIFDESQWDEHNKIVAEIRKVTPNACGYEHGLLGMTDGELFPKAGKRHMITPPQGGKMSLVCCKTTKGNLAFVAHHKWAPLGAERVIDMVKSGYFDSGVPMFRCIKNFLCQFGLNNDKEVTKKYNANLQDDPQWLPEGPKHRENDQGVKRFAKGYLAYAGGGPNTRSNQLIVALKADGPLAGGSPWEVPWGELVGEESYETLSNFYTGYDEDGPPQGKLHNRGMDKEMKKEFPDVDYINECVLVDERTTANESLQ